MFKRRLRRMRKPTELLLVPMIDIFTVLVTFLLMTAVFSRITIVELDLPSSSSASVTAPTFRLEVIVRKEGFELTNGSALIATIPKVDGEYDMKSLADLALSLKRDYPDAVDASVLLQPDIEYDNLIQVMDVIRSAELPANSELLAEFQPIAAPATAPPALDAPAPGEGEATGAAKAAPSLAAPKTVRVALFTDIAVGDAP
jgi:biopolymer transport protein ExbD